MFQKECNFVFDKSYLHDFNFVALKIIVVDSPNCKDSFLRDFQASFNDLYLNFFVALKTIIGDNPICEDNFLSNLLVSF